MKEENSIRMRKTNVSIQPIRNYVIIRGEVVFPVLGLTSDSVSSDARFTFYVDGLGEDVTNINIGDKVKLDLALYGNQMANTKQILEENNNSRERLTKHYNMSKNKDYKDKVKNKKRIKVLEYFMIQSQWISGIDLSKDNEEDILPML